MRLRKGDHVKEHAWCGAASVNPAHPRMCCLSQIPGAVFNLESTDSSFIFLSEKEKTKIKRIDRTKRQSSHQCTGMGRFYSDLL